MKTGTHLLIFSVVWLLAGLLCPHSSFASIQENFKPRTFQLEWDPVEGAQSYDIEISEAGSEAKEEKRFSTKEIEWSGQLLPGDYFLRLRARDKRNVPSDWSEKTAFHVGLANVVLLKPSPNFQIMTDQLESAKIRFQWQPVDSAENYQIKIVSDDEKVKIEKEIKQTSFEESLPVAKAYRIEIRAYANEKIFSDDWTIFRFRVLGKIEKPQIEAPSSLFVRELQWNPGDHSTTASLKLFRFSEETKTWVLIHEKADSMETKMAFLPEWAGGRYRLSVRSHAENRISSEESVIDFPVKSGDRSEHAEYTETRRLSIESAKGWTVQFGMTPGFYSYYGVNPENSTATPVVTQLPDFLANETNIRVSRFAENATQGFDFRLSQTSMILDSKNYSFFSLESNLYHKRRAFEAGDVRQFMGAFYQTRPEILGSIDYSYDVRNLGLLGVHYGIEYWHALNSRWALQGSLDFTHSLMILQGAAGKSLDHETSVAVGTLAKRKFGLEHAALFGLKFREERISYQGGGSGSGSNAIFLNSIGFQLLWEWMP